jgi:hypothetical protein
MSNNNRDCTQCFEKFYYNLPFWIKRKGYENCPCVTRKCPNYDICKNEITELSFRDCCDDCTCNGVYEKTELKDECPICFENNFLYKLKECNHFLCGDCIHKLYFPDYGKLEDYPERPSFPYNHCETCGDNCNCGNFDEDGNHNYFEHEDDPKWLDDEKIQEWKKRDDFFTFCCENFVKQPDSNTCPLCRKEQNY